MMELGTTGAFGFDDFHPPEVLALYAGVGCRVVQIYRNRALKLTPSDIRPVCDDLGLRIDSIHGHFGDDLDPSSEDETIRTYSVGVYEFEADFCRRLGGDLVVVHPSPSQSPVGNLERRYAQLRKSFDELAEAGERMGVRYAFENMPGYHPVGADAARLVREVAAAGSDRIVFLLDTGHAHMTGGLDAAIRAAGPHLKYTHVHDNDGTHDTHLLPYHGTIDWNACRNGLHAIRYDGVFLLEVFETAGELRSAFTEDWKRNVHAILDAAASVR
jgi:sugar phosphate isomerase/epimerase